MEEKKIKRDKKKKRMMRKEFGVKRLSEYEDDSSDGDEGKIRTIMRNEKNRKRKERNKENKKMFKEAVTEQSRKILGLGKMSRESMEYHRARASSQQEAWKQVVQEFLEDIRIVECKLAEMVQPYM